MKKSLIIAISFLIVGFWACKKEHVHHHDEDKTNNTSNTDNTSTPTTTDKAPKVDLLSPSENKELKTGDTLKVVANVSHDRQLHEWSIILRNEANEIVWERGKHTHAQNIIISENWVNTISADNNLKLTLNVKDHYGEERTILVNLKVKN
jgi:hypothetical protein